MEFNLFRNLRGGKKDGGVGRWEEEIIVLFAAKLLEIFSVSLATMFFIFFLFPFCYFFSPNE